MHEKLKSEEAALIKQGVQEYLLKLQSEHKDASDNEFLNHQIEVAQSVFDKVLGLRLSKDGKTVSSFEESPDDMLVFKANYKYHGRDKKLRTGDMVVQAWHKNAVKDTIKDRLQKERGWERGWIHVDTIQQLEAIADAN
ncbi:MULTISPECIES: hypothetical protein [unclassified Paenibacillus]|uniref:hypothetical protein n=1 Tax=unclassified Paenibacillus TaxID=185978 RepID=UPI000838AF95|nr:MULTISPECIES: hypothetical protein [unclassified Paenibacillus]NWL88072.1 hypothetical protein [Paenibacillus sp. 79R4]